MNADANPPVSSHRQTKQGIHPTAELEAILTPQLERVVHDLNARVRKTFLKLRAMEPNTRVTDLAAARDERLEPPKRAVRCVPTKATTRGLTSSIERAKLMESRFFVVRVSNEVVPIVLNEHYPFYRDVNGDNRRCDAGSAHSEKRRCVRLRYSP